MRGNIFSPEDKEFMEIVQSDLRRYLEKNIFPSRTVLVFPPFNGFRRFLIHKLIEDNFASSEVAAFSIGQDIARRIVICYKGLISEAASKGLPATIPQPTKSNMIDKEKPNRQRQTPTAAVYRPPAARLAENRKSTDSTKSADTKQTRVRRPDQQMYVPRPKRASYDNDLPRSRSRSNSRLSLDSDLSSDLKKTSSISSEESRVPTQNEGCMDENAKSSPPCVTEVKVIQPDSVSTSNNQTVHPLNGVDTINSGNCEIGETISATITAEVTSPVISEEISKSESEEIKDADKSVSCKTVEDCCPTELESKNKNEGDMLVDSQDNVECLALHKEIQSENGTEKIILPSNDSSENIKENSSNINSLSNEAMETISISSDSKSESSSSSFMSCSESKTSDSSVDSEAEKVCKEKRPENMDVDNSESNDSVPKSKRKSQHKERKSTKKAQPSTPKMTEVLVISDSSSNDDSVKIEESKKKKSTVEKSKSQLTPKVQLVKVESSSKQMKNIDPNECDWESLYDESGECLVPSLMEELTNSVGRVRITSADSDYRPYQSVEERTNDGECVIEIYDFPAEFKTTDLFNIFAAYRNKNFQVKWVDDTHALGIFPSPFMADEVLACTLPFVKTRPLRLGIAESRNKARNLVLPPLPAMERPKTCPALARRLVTGALGLRIPTSSQEREKEKQVLKEAREKRRLETKQREAAWDGTITSGSVI